MSSHSPTPTLLLPNLPPRTLVGIDLTSFTSTSNFHGIRDLTPGWHFLYTGTTESFSLRIGSWFHVGRYKRSPYGGKAAEADQNAVTLRGNGQSNVRGQANSRGSEIRIWKWNHDVEGAVPLREDNESERQEAMRHRANLGAVWQSGGLYGYGSQPQAQGQDRGRAREDDDMAPPDVPDQSDWPALTQHLSPELLSRVLGPPQEDGQGLARWAITSASSAARDVDHIPGLTSNEAASAVEAERELCFLPVDLKRTWREGAVGRERTEGARDRSWALGDLIQRFYAEAPSTASDPSPSNEEEGERQILGELQLTFLMILTLANYSCLEQWKRLLMLLLTCREAVRERQAFFVEVLRVLRLQLQHFDDVEGGLFDMDGDDGGALLRKLLMGFTRIIDEQLSEGKSPVKHELAKLEDWVSQEYGWVLRKEAIVRRGMLELEDGEQVEMEMEGTEEDDETGEYAPMIVDLGEGGGETPTDIQEDH